MVCNLKYLREQFNTFNSLYFDGELPVPHLRIGSSRRMLGSVRYRRERRTQTTENQGITLTISNCYDLPQSELDDTIIHEMIHLAIIVSGAKDTSTHGKIFRRTAAEINRRFGRNITVSHKGPLVRAQEKSRGAIIAVCRFRDGTTCLMRPSRTRLFRLRAAILAAREISSAAWYLSANPFFETFPRAMKPKFYRIENETLARELAGAIELDVSATRVRKKIKS
ncbi:MAG: SprT-like domain-containing protein [Prevotella sp.]|nr:SprT-like domain-containing protein [Prevotella sp.]